MATSVSKYRSGAPRFGTKKDDWKLEPPKVTQLTPEQLERVRAGETVEQVLKGDKNMANNDSKKVESKTVQVDLKAENEGVSKELEYLKREVIDAHKLVTETEQAVEEWKGAFDDAMSAKEQLQKENFILENDIQRLRESNKGLEEQYHRIINENIELTQKLKALKLYTFEELKRDLYSHEHCERVDY